MKSWISCIMCLTVGVQMTGTDALAQSSGAPKTVEDCKAIFELIRRDLQVANTGFRVEGTWRTQRLLMIEGPQVAPSYRKPSSEFAGAGEFILRAQADVLRIDFAPAKITPAFMRAHGERLASGSSLFRSPTLQLTVGLEGRLAEVRQRAAIDPPFDWPLPMLRLLPDELAEAHFGWPWPEKGLPREGVAYSINLSDPKAVNAECVEIEARLELDDPGGRKMLPRIRRWTLDKHFGYRPSRLELLTGDILTSRHEMEWASIGQERRWVLTRLATTSIVRDSFPNAPAKESSIYEIRFDPKSWETGEGVVALDDLTVSPEMLQQMGVPTDGSSPAARTDPHNQTFVEKVQENIWRIVFVLSLATGIALLLIRHRMNKPA